MQLTGEANNQDLTSEIDFLCDTTSTSYPLADKVRRINSSLEELVGDIINSDGTWQYDDTNHTDLPIGTANLVDAQESYSFTDDYLQITAVEILDPDGSTYRRIKPLDVREIPGEMGPDEYFNDTGFPEFYDVMGDTLFLYPAPATADVTLTAGLKVWFKRTVDLFTIADTTQEPGLPSTHHILLAYMAALPYNAVYHQERVPWLERKIADMKRTLMAHYAFREKDKKKRIRPKRLSFR